MRLSPPTVLICGALLFVSLAGNAAAVTGLITSKDIKNGTIRLEDLSPATRAALNGASGPQGPQGAPGAPGVQGPQGPAGQSANTFALEQRLSSLESKESQTSSKID